MDLSEELQKMYDSKFFFQITIHLDGILFELLDETSHHIWEQSFQTFERGISTLILKVIEFYPYNNYSQKKIKAWNKISEGFVDLNNFTNLTKVEMLITQEEKIQEDEWSKQINEETAWERGNEVHQAMKDATKEWVDKKTEVENV